MSSSSASTEIAESLRSGLRPIVILGAPRSGTKLLRDLLGQGENCKIIPYGLNHVWRTGLSYHDSDRRPPSHATERRVRQIRSILLDLGDAHRAPESGYLVEKTCANTLRVPFVYRVLPDAQYVHIVRDGRDAVTSAREKWERSPTLQHLFGKLRYVPLRHSDFLLEYIKNLCRGLGSGRSVEYWGPRYDGMKDDMQSHSLLHVCARQWKTCVETCLGDLAALPSDQYVSIRYESLVTNGTALHHLLDMLDLADPASVRDYYRSVVHDESVGRWRRDLTRSEQETLNVVLDSTLDRVEDLMTITDT